MIEDPTIFNDIAEALNAENRYNIQAAFVEKDYYAVQLLNLINSLTLDNCSLIFAGGTCLAKAYQNTFRMSEDIDIKFTGANSALKRSDRKALRKLVEEGIEKSDIFELSEVPDSQKNPIIASTYRTQTYSIAYPKSFEHPALRESLKLELVESIVYEPVCQFPVCSIYAKKMDEYPEINSTECANIESIIVEKLIALLWRTSAIFQGKDVEDDEALVRHLYDIHLVINNKRSDINTDLLSKFFIESRKYQADQYKSKYLEFFETPEKILEHGFKEIQSNSIHKERYEQMLLPLIYSSDLPSWNVVLDTFKKLYKELR